MVTLQHYLMVGVALFCLGLYTVMTRRNAVGLLIGVELLLNSANINFLAFAHFNGNNIEGHILALFNIVLAASEAAVALAIVVMIYKNFHTIDTDAATEMRR